MVCLVEDEKGSLGYGKILRCFESPSQQAGPMAKSATAAGFTAVADLRSVSNAPGLVPRYAIVMTLTIEELTIEVAATIINACRAPPTDNEPERGAPGRSSCACGPPARRRAAASCGSCT